MLLGVGVPHELHGTAHGVQGVPELVGQHGEELVLAAVGHRQLLLVPPTLGVVAGHIRESEELAVLVPEGRDEDAGPEPRTVLAYPPLLLPVGALLGGGLEGLLRLSRLSILGCVEQREVPPENLVCT